MTDPIQLSNLNPTVNPTGVAGVARSTAAPSESAVKGKGFREILLDSLDQVNRLQTEADQGVQRLITGETDNVAEVFTAVNKAGVAFDLLMEIRNKLTDAYREIQQMRV